MRKQNNIIIWPVYFDSTKTRKAGRRISKNLAVQSPNASEIKIAMENVGFEYNIVEGKSYPKTSWLKSGMFATRKMKTKDQTIRNIAKQLLKNRNLTTKK